MEQPNEMNRKLDDLRTYEGAAKNCSDLFDKYYKAFERIDLSSENNKEAIKMLERRLFIPEIDEQLQSKGVLIVGANPSYNPDDENKNFTKSFEELYVSPKDHWREVAALAKVQGNKHIGAYLDFFPIKQTNLGEFEKAFRKLAEVRARMLQVTHERMVSLHPKVIVNLFAMISYYWGYNADKENFCDTEKPWMGYTFDKMPADGLNAYKISGWLHGNKKCILPDDESLRLDVGAIVLFSTRVYNKEVREQNMVTAEKLKRFLDENRIVCGE